MSSSNRRWGGNVVLIIDDAQNLSSRVLENLRMLSNFETQSQILIQIVLSGQNDLDDVLKTHNMRQMVQRISLKRYSQQLSHQGTTDYICHRLQVAGYDGANLYSDAAMGMICNYSEGLPRKINIICDNALLTGHGIGQHTIDASITEEVIDNLDLRKTSNLRKIVDLRGRRHFKQGDAISYNHAFFAAGIVGLITLMSMVLIQSSFSTSGGSRSRAFQSFVQMAGR